MDRFGSLWGPYQHVRYPSEYEPHADEPGRDRWLEPLPNRTAHAWLLEHPGPPRPWLICVPGYRMGHPAVDFTGFQTRWLHLDLGLNLAIPVLPLHGPRRVGRRGGDGFLTGDFMDTIHAQTQAVWDARRLIRWLRKHRSERMGLYGVSLGGYTTALLAALESDLDCAIAGNPASDYVALFRAHVPGFLLEAAGRMGVGFDTIEHVMRVVSPLAMPARVPHDRRFIFAGLTDRLTPPDQARRLWEWWERPQMTWYEGTHVSFLFEPEIRRTVRDALAKSGLIAGA